MFFGKKKAKPAAPEVAAEKPAAAAPLAAKPALAKTAAPAPAVAPARQPAQPVPPSRAAAAPSVASQVASAASASGSAKHPLQALGEIVSLMMTSPTFKEAAMADLVDLVVPAIRHNQIAVAEARDDKGNSRPVAAVVWARVSPEIDRRLMSSAEFPPQIKTDEWASGDIAWVVMAVGAQKACDATIAQISKSQLGGRSMKVPSFEGSTVVVREVTAAA